MSHKIRGRKTSTGEYNLMIKLTYQAPGYEAAKVAITSSDLKDALRIFKEKTHVDATVVEVAEKNIPALESVLPEGLELLPHGGCAGYEIWLSSPKYSGEEKIAPLKLSESPSPAPVVENLPLHNSYEVSNTKGIYANTEKSVKNGRGRPKKELQANFLDILSDPSMTLMKKSEKLGIHFTTVQRRMKKLSKI